MRVLRYRDFTLDYTHWGNGSWEIVATHDDYAGDPEHRLGTDSESFKADIDEWYETEDQRWIDEIKKG